MNHTVAMPVFPHEVFQLREPINALQLPNPHLQAGEVRIIENRRVLKKKILTLG